MTTTDPVAHDVDAPSLARPRLRAARAAGLRAGAADQAGQGRRRHQELPLPRSRPAARAGGVDVGPEHRDGHGHPPEHRLPVPDGPVLLGHAPASACPRGCRNACGSARSCSPPPSACCSSCARCRVRGPGAVVATVLFMLTPYTLDFAARISVILLPWAGLPWMLALTIRALRARDGRGAWRYAAIFAIVVQIVGGVNATALVFAGIAPVLWIVYAIVDRRGRLAARARRDRAHRAAHACSRRCGGSPGSGRRAATGSTS